MADVTGIKISQLESTTDLQDLYTIGTDKNNSSKKVKLQFLKEAADYANAQGDYAKESADNIVGNIGVNDYPAFSESGSYASGDVVNYNGKLYRFTAPHQSGAWNGNDVVPTSINAESQRKLTELDQEVENIKESGGGGLVNIKNNTPLKVWVGTEEEAEGLDTDAEATLYIIIPSKVYYTISKTLKGCTIDNEQNEVAEGGAYHATILPADGYAIQSVIVTMDGKDITSTAYSNGMITISKVVGNVAIIAEASESISEPVMDGLGIWLDASDNMDGTYAEDSTTWISKVPCGDLGHYQVELINTHFEEKKVVFAPTDASKPCMCLGLYNPFSAGAMGVVGTGDFTVEVVVDSDFSVYNTAGDSIMFLGVNAYATNDATFNGRWRFGLYNKTNKYMDLWCNDGTGGFGTSAYSPSAGKHTLTAVRSSGVVSYYDNGVYVGKVAFTKRLVSDRGAAVANQRLGLHIGQQNNTYAGTYNNGFKGCLYDVKMYARALSADEVQQNHQFNNQHYLLGL